MGIAPVNYRIGVILPVIIDAPVSNIQNGNADRRFPQDAVGKRERRANSFKQARLTRGGKTVNGHQEGLASGAGVGEHVQAVLVAQKTHPGIGGQFDDFPRQCLLRSVHQGGIAGEIENEQDQSDRCPGPSWEITAAGLPLNVASNFGAGPQPSSSTQAGMEILAVCAWAVPSVRASNREVREPVGGIGALEAELQSQLDDAPTVGANDSAGVDIGITDRTNHRIRIVPVRVVQDVQSRRIKLKQRARRRWGGVCPS